MKQKQHRRSDCPINFALETFGDSWSLLIVRDIVYFGKKTYREFLESDEGIATNILASRLAQLEQKGLLLKKPHERDKRKEVYVLTEKGLDLLPILLEMAGWSVQHDPRFCNRAAVIDWREVIRRVMEHQRRDIDLWCQNLIDNGGADVSNVAALVNAAYRHYLERIGRLPRPMTDDYAEVIGSRRVTVAESHGTIVG